MAKRIKPRSVTLWKMLEKWFVVLALFLFTGAALPLLRQGNSIVDAESDPVAQIIFIGVYGITFLLIVVHRRHFVYLAARNKLLLLLIILCLASVFWSAAPEITLRRSVALVGTTLFGAYLATRYSLGEQLRLIAWALGIASVLSLAIILVLPSYGASSDPYAEGWQGAFVHKNTLGRLMTLSALLFLLRALSGYRYRLVAWAGFGLSMGLLLLSNSKTALVVFVISISLLPFYKALRWTYTLTVPFVIAVILLGGALITWFLGNEEAVLDTLGRDITLTGRTELWSAVLDMIWQHPWLGHGYNGFWSGPSGGSANIRYLIGFDPAHAHNGFLDLWLDLGLLGLLTFGFGFLLIFLKSAIWARLTTKPEGLWPLLYLTVLFLYNLTESTILTRNSIFWVLYVATAFSTSMLRSRAGRTNPIGASVCGTLERIGHNRPKSTSRTGRIGS